VKNIHFGADINRTDKGDGAKNQINGEDNPSIKHGHTHELRKEPS
jgi:hypothetical protein